MKTALRILIVEDSEDDSLLILHQIRKAGYEVESERVETAVEMNALLNQKEWDIILSDYQMPHFNGIEALAITRESGIDIPFIIISGTIGEEIAVKAMKTGAHDYIMKNNLQRLLPAVERELRESENRAERKILEQKQKKAEALKESEDKFKNLVRDMPVGILLQNANGEVLINNTQTLELLGLTENQLLGKTSCDTNWNAIHEDKLPFPRHTQPFYQAIASKQPVRDIVMGICRPTKGDCIWLLVDAIPLLNEDGTIRQVVSTFIDISGRKLAEEEIKHKNEELLKINAEKDRFFSIIAHDLRSPFNVFLGYTELMVTELPSLTMEKVQKFAVHIRNSANNLSRLIENLLQWARIQQGLIPFKPELITILSILEESIAIILDSAKSKEIEITYNIPANLKVYADSDMFQTIFRNLVSNAVKFTNKRGNITISAKINDNKSVEFSIKDSGIGMNDTMINNLFRIDVRTNRIGTEGEPSTGLGLLLCKDFIEKHGGKIWVESEEKKGTTFYFTIPDKQ